MEMIKSMKKYLKKSLAIILAIAVILTTMSVGFLGFASEFNVSKVDNAVIVVPETVYMTPNTGASTTGQYYVNNDLDANGKVTTKAEYAQTSGVLNMYIDGAKSVSVSVSNAELGGEIAEGTTYSFLNNNFKKSVTLNCSSGIAAGDTVLAEWTFTVTMNDGSTRVYYAYSTLYAPFYSPVGAAGWARSHRMVAAGQQAYAGSILWVSGVHGFSECDVSSNTSFYKGAYYPNASSFIPMAGILTAPSGNPRPTGGAEWITTSQSTPHKTISYVEEESDEKNAVGVLSVSPVAQLTLDTSRYDNFNQLPNFKVGFMITDTENSNRQLICRMTENRAVKAT